MSLVFLTVNDLWTTFQKTLLMMGLESQQVRRKNPAFGILEPRETYLMSFCIGGPSTGPNSANLMEWVEQQAVRLPGPSKASTADHGIAPVPESSVAAPARDPPAKWNPNLNTADEKLRVYDIATLYSLRKEATRKNVELKIHTAALKENIWKSATGHGYSKSHERSRLRASSDDSVQTQRSLESGEEIVLGRKLGEITRPPYRQPIPAPEELHDQKRDGFKRFLKEVASPPHHRVTAGGRIVPAGTQPPPMMMQFDSLDDSLQHRQARHKSFGKSVNRPEPPPGNILTVYSNSKMNSRVEGQGKVPINGQPYLFKSQAGLVPHQNAGKMANVASLNNQQLLSYAVPAGALPLGPLSTPFPSNHFLGHWNGAPMYNQLLPVPPYSYAEHVLSMYGQPYTLSQDILPATARNSSLTQSSVDTSDHQLTSLIGLPQESLVKSRDEYVAQLSELDKHIALNLHKFTPNQVARNAARREELVKTIDLFRVAMETSSKTDKSPSGPIAEPTLFPGKSQPNFQPYSITSTEGQQSVGLHETGYVNQTTSKPAQTGSASNSSTSQPTSLSAVAPPFVPGSFSAGLTRFNFGDTSLGTKPPGTTSESKNGFNGSTQLTPSFSIHTSPVVGKTMHGNDKIDTSDDAAIDSRVRSPFAVPEVDPRDIAYVDRLGLNPIQHEKKFCSTVEEFQEVIRRAREQATTYSCTPGASKDPAHDAEEDIRCAMQNEEAIVLPQQIPDHIANPRPWNWLDSAYNARAHPELAPFLPAEKVSPLKSVGSSSRWSNSLHPILEENVPDEGGHGHGAGAANATPQRPENSNQWGSYVYRNGASSSETDKSIFANAEQAVAPIAESKTIYEGYNNGENALGMTKARDWKAIQAPEVKMPHGKNMLGSPLPRAGLQLYRKNENSFLQGMLRFPKFSRQNGNPVPSDAEVMAQQLKFEEISASQRSKKENSKSGVSGERGANAKDVFEAARAAFFPKARVSVGPSYQNALGILPPPNQRGSSLNRAGIHTAPSGSQVRVAGNESTSSNASLIYNSSPLRHVSGQLENTLSSPWASNKAAHMRENPLDQERKTLNNRLANPVA